jgi:hypothetical protein
MERLYNVDTIAFLQERKQKSKQQKMLSSVEGVPPFHEDASLQCTTQLACGRGIDEKLSGNQKD